MKITYYGQSYFKIKCQNIEITIDPYNQSTVTPSTKIKTDALLITHNQKKQNLRDMISNETMLIDGPGEYEINGTFIYGKEAYHNKDDNHNKDIITIYKIEDEKLKLAHLSNVGQNQLTQEQLEFLNDVDVLLIPVGGGDTINSKEATKIINELEPRIVIPMNYKIPGLKMDLDPLDNFLKEIGLDPETVDEYKVTKNDLPIDSIKLVILNKQ